MDAARRQPGRQHAVEGSFSLIDQILVFCPDCFTKQIFRFNSDFFLSHLVILARFELWCLNKIYIKHIINNIC